MVNSTSLLFDRLNKSIVHLIWEHVKPDPSGGCPRSTQSALYSTSALNVSTAVLSGSLLLSVSAPGTR
jgi:hypothetical protein